MIQKIFFSITGEKGPNLVHVLCCSPVVMILLLKSGCSCLGDPKIEKIYFKVLCF